VDDPRQVTQDVHRLLVEFIRLVVAHGFTS
jgi:hypothetical protein